MEHQLFSMHCDINRGSLTTKEWPFILTEFIVQWKQYINNIYLYITNIFINNKLIIIIRISQELKFMPIQLLR